ncbi:MAG: hypothetical protein WEB85_02525, partial [Dongiaceae bacterium]
MVGSLAFGVDATRRRPCHSPPEPQPSVSFTRYSGGTGYSSAMRRLILALAVLLACAAGAPAG